MLDVHERRKAVKASNLRKAVFCVGFVCLVAFLYKAARATAADRPERRRWDQDRLISLGIFENTFSREYRMSHKCFEALEKLLLKDLTSDEKFAKIRALGTKSPPITPTS